MHVSLQFGNCAGSTSNSSLFGYLSVKSSCNSSYLVRIDSHSSPSHVFSFLYDKATLSSSAVSSSVQVKYSLSVLPSELAFLFLDAILHLVKKTFCAWGDGKTTDKCRELHPVISSHLNRRKLSHGSVWTECPVEIFGLSKIRSAPCECSLRQTNSWLGCGIAADTNVSLVSSTFSLQNEAILTENDGVPGSKFESDP